MIPYHEHLKTRYMPAKENVRKMFDNIAAAYDKLNHILSLDIDRAWRKKAVKEIVDGSSRIAILDVACGTGDFSIAIARKITGRSLVIGVDLSANMLDIGRKKIVREGLQDKIVLEQGDCEQLRFPDGNFDRVSAAFGVRNFEHLETGIKEMYRVLKPGGKVVILELSVPDNRILRALYKLYFLHILPAVGGIISGNREAYRYLPASVLRFPEPQAFAEIMSSCGFSDVRTTAFSAGICRMYTGTKGQGCLKQEDHEAGPGKNSEKEGRDYKERQLGVEGLA